MINWDEIDDLAKKSRNDLEAVDQLIRQLLPWIRGFFRRSGAADDDARDLAQQVAVKIYQGRHAFEPEKGAYRCWLRQVSRNLWIDYLRLIRRRSESPLPEPALSDNSPSVYVNLSRQEQLQALEECVEELSDTLRIVVALHVYEGIQLQAIAVKLRRPDATVRDWYRRAKFQIRDCLVGKGF